MTLESGKPADKPAHKPDKSPEIPAIARHLLDEYLHQPAGSSATGNFASDTGSLLRNFVNNPQNHGTITFEGGAFRIDARDNKGNEASFFEAKGGSSKVDIKYTAAHKIEIGGKSYSCTELTETRDPKGNNVVSIRTSDGATVTQRVDDQGNPVDGPPVRGPTAPHVVAGGKDSAPVAPPDAPQVPPTSPAESSAQAQLQQMYDAFPNQSPEQQLQLWKGMFAAGRPVAGSDSAREITVNDGGQTRTYRLETERIGNAQLFHVFSEGKDGEHIAYRFLERQHPDGTKTVENERNEKGHFVSFTGSVFGASHPDSVFAKTAGGSAASEGPAQQPRPEPGEAPALSPRTAGGPPGYPVGPHTAIYDIAAHTVYLPDGERLEAHSGLGRKEDDPRYVSQRGSGPTPPNIYDLKMRERLFHGVPAIRLNPENGSRMYGRDGILAHTYMLGPSGQSNGCVVFKNYSAFLSAYKHGEITRLLVVPHLSEPPQGPAATPETPRPGPQGASDSDRGGPEGSYRGRHHQPSEGHSASPGRAPGFDPRETPLTGGEKAAAKEIYGYLINKGLSPYAASAALGNMMAESSFDTGDPDHVKGPFGLIQWRGGRLGALEAYAEMERKSVADWRVQMDFMLHELQTGYTRAYNAMQHARGPAEAAAEFDRWYEVSGGTARAKRERYALAFYNMFSGTAASP